MSIPNSQTDLAGPSSPSVDDGDEDEQNEMESRNKILDENVSNKSQLSSQYKKSDSKQNSSKFVTYDLEDQIDTEPVEHIDDLPSTFLQRILNYLRIWELSKIRLVSRYWNEQILHKTSYPEKSCILLTNDRVTTSCETLVETLDEFDPIFNRVRMLGVQPPQVGKCLSPTFSANVTHLELFYCAHMNWSIFLDLLISCHNLEELKVRKCCFKWPYDTEEWRNKYIEWVSKIQKSGNRFPDLKAIEFRAKDPHDVLYMWKLVLEHSTRLQKISYTCKSPSKGLKLNSGVEDLDDMYETVMDLFDTTVEIINKFSENLQQFHSYLIDHTSQGHRNGHNSNNSTTPTSSIPSSTTTNDPFKHLANKQDSFNNQNSTIMNQFCSSVLAKLDKTKGLNLKSFCLYGGEISNKNIPIQANILGDFIQSQKNLEKVILPFMRFGNTKEFQNFLRKIPKTVRCIRIPTFDRMPDCLSFEFGRLNEYYVEAHGTPDLQIIIPPGTLLPNVKTFSFYNCSDWVWQTVKIVTILNSFPCLTELLIRDDGTHQCTRIGDSDMQSICRYLPYLKKLHLTNVDCVTDYGFTGICEKECRLMNETGTYVPSPGTKIGYSVSSLKRLEYLCLFKIGFRVTNVSLIYGFVFQDLRFMTLQGYPKVTPWGVECLRNNNDKLKRWNIEFQDPSFSQVFERPQPSTSTSPPVSRPHAVDNNPNE